MVFLVEDKSIKHSILWSYEINNLLNNNLRGVLV